MLANKHFDHTRIIFNVKHTYLLHWVKIKHNKFSILISKTDAGNMKNEYHNVHKYN